VTEGGENLQVLSRSVRVEREVVTGLGHTNRGRVSGVRRNVWVRVETL
jgi:hypothetical protein